MTKRTLSEIWVYPIKSLGGIAMPSAVTQPRGLCYDRRWMLVNEAGRFVSQREIPNMALLGTAVEPPYLSVFWKKNPQEKLLIPLETDLAEITNLRVQVWGDQCTASVLGMETNQWFSDNLHQSLRLVFMPDTTRRPADGRYAPRGQHVSFADGFPYLIIGQATLDELNSRLEKDLPMNRFRPNFVFTGGQAFEEDGWGKFAIGNAAFQGVKPCSRCIITTTDQDTAARAAEPLKTLATYRKVGNGIRFGQNVVWLGEGENVVRVGDPLEERPLLNHK